MFSCLIIHPWSSFNIYSCKYKNKVYAYKEFKDPYKINTKKFICKLQKISEFELEKSIIPSVLVLNIYDIPIGYLLKKTSKFEYYDLNTLRERLQCLNGIKQSILELHENGIIHSDIHSGNFLKSKGRYVLCDFDNCAFSYYKPLIKHCSSAAENYLRTYGLNKELDIYLLNLLTFSSLNCIPYQKAAFNVLLGDYGIFDNSDAKSICNSFLLKDSSPNKEFLVDYIDKNKILKKIN